jgi:hypothetical protein
MSQAKIGHMRLGVKCFGDLELFQIEGLRAGIEMARTHWVTEKAVGSNNRRFGYFIDDGL